MPLHVGLHSLPPAMAPPELTDTQSARRPPSLKCCLMRAAIWRPLPTPAPSPAALHARRNFVIALRWDGRSMVKKVHTERGKTSHWIPCPTAVPVACSNCSPRKKPARCPLGKCLEKFMLA